MQHQLLSLHRQFSLAECALSDPNQGHIKDTNSHCEVQSSTLDTSDGTSSPQSRRKSVLQHDQSTGGPTVGTSSPAPHSPFPSMDPHIFQCIRPMQVPFPAITIPTITISTVAISTIPMPTIPISIIISSLPSTIHGYKALKSPILCSAHHREYPHLSRMPREFARARWDSPSPTIQYGNCIIPFLTRLQEHGALQVKKLTHTIIFDCPVFMKLSLCFYQCSSGCTDAHQCFTSACTS